MDDIKEIGRRITWLRKTRALTVREVAVEIGLSRSQLTLIENGLRPPGRRTLVELAFFFGVSIDWLVTGSGAPIEMPITDDEARLLMWWRKADAASRCAVAAFVGTQVDLRVVVPDWVEEPWRLLGMTAPDIPPITNGTPHSAPQPQEDEGPEDQENLLQGLKSSASG